jgi:hypothetical protein
MAKESMDLKERMVVLAGEYSNVALKLSRMVYENMDYVDTNKMIAYIAKHDLEAKLASVLGMERFSEDRRKMLMLGMEAGSNNDKEDFLDFNEENMSDMVFGSVDKVKDKMNEIMGSELYEWAKQEGEETVTNYMNDYIKTFGELCEGKKTN